jgi:hypothetical protein
MVRPAKRGRCRIPPARVGLSPYIYRKGRGTVTFHDVLGPQVRQVCVWHAVRLGSPEWAPQLRARSTGRPSFHAVKANHGSGTSPAGWPSQGWERLAKAEFGRDIEFFPENTLMRCRRLLHSSLTHLTSVRQPACGRDFVDRRGPCTALHVRARGQLSRRTRSALAKPGTVDRERREVVKGDAPILSTHLVSPVVCGHKLTTGPVSRAAS